MSTDVVSKAEDVGIDRKAEEQPCLDLYYEPRVLRPSRSNNGNLAIRGRGRGPRAVTQELMRIIHYTVADNPHRALRVNNGCVGGGVFDTPKQKGLLETLKAGCDKGRVHRWIVEYDMVVLASGEDRDRGRDRR